MLRKAKAMEFAVLIRRLDKEILRTISDGFTTLLCNGVGFLNKLLAYAELSPSTYRSGQHVMLTWKSVADIAICLFNADHPAYLGQEVAIAAKKAGKNGVHLS